MERRQEQPQPFDIGTMNDGAYFAELADKAYRVMGLPLLRLEPGRRYDLYFLPTNRSRSAWWCVELKYFFWPLNGNKLRILDPRTYGKERKSYIQQMFWQKLVEAYPDNSPNFKEKRKAAYKDPRNRKYLSDAERLSIVWFHGRLWVLSVPYYVWKDAEAAIKHAKGGVFWDPDAAYMLHVDAHGDNGGRRYTTSWYGAESSHAIFSNPEMRESVLSQLPDLQMYASEKYQWGKNGSLYTPAQTHSILNGEFDPRKVREYNQWALDTMNRIPADDSFKKFILSNEKKAHQNIGSPPPEDHLPTSVSTVDKFTRMTREELMGFCREQRIRPKRGMSDEEIRELLRGQ